MSAPTERSAGADPGTTRRAALALGAAGTAALLTGCAVYGESDDSADAGPADASAEAAPDDQATAEPGTGAGKAAGGAALAKAADIPVGSGKIFAKKGVVVTQPTAGTFKAFSTKCTHQGCPVTKIKDGTINCECHGSKFKIDDGSVADGPASKPLAAKKISVEGDAITLDA